MMSSTLHAPVAGQVLDQPAGDPDLPVGRAGLALLVDGQRDHGRAVLAHQRHDLVEARVGAVAVLVVDRVDHRAAAEHLQARPPAPRARWSRARSAAWRRWRSGTPAPSCRPRRRARRSRRTGRACARRRGPGPARSPRTPPSSAPASPRGTPWSRWRWCARRWPGRRCPGGTGRSGRARPRAASGRGRRGATSLAAHPLDHLAQVLGGGAAAAADQRQAVVAGEGLVRVGQLARG